MGRFRSLTLSAESKLSKITYAEIAEYYYNLLNTPEPKKSYCIHTDVKELYHHIKEEDTKGPTLSRKKY